ncbi:MAG TPA: hypothetical protein VGP63_00535, partial [Planctomycetaceae bacterium]|nr:hypothetical protein [Planctomycetaceae bacterium]
MLDDEADLCPFCGAPLKKSTSSAAKASPAPRPAAPPSGPSTSSKPTSPAPSGQSPSRPANPGKPASGARPGSPGTGKGSFAQDKLDAEDSARSAAHDALEESFRVDTTAGLDIPVAS